jgi:hypothetical protein
VFLADLDVEDEQLLDDEVAAQTDSKRLIALDFIYKGSCLVFLNSKYTMGLYIRY